MAPIKISEMKEIIRQQLKQEEDQRINLCFVGHQGIGKTEAIKEVIDETNGEWTYKALYGSQTQVEDLMGMPSKEKDENGNDITKFAKPILFPDKEKTVFVLEEINRSQLDVQQAILQLLTEKKFAGHRLPTNTIIIISINPSDRNNPYNVDELDPVFYNRVCKLEVEPDLDEWLQYAKQKKFNNKIISFLSINYSIKDELFSKKPTLENGNSNQTLPSPRTWEFASKILNIKNIENNKNLLNKLLAGVIGQDVANKFIGDMDLLNLVLGSSILDNYTEQIFQAQKNNDSMMQNTLQDLAREIKFRYNSDNLSEENIENCKKAFNNLESNEYKENFRSKLDPDILCKLGI